MALSASTVVEINSLATASNVNGGGFNPANAGMLTDLTCTLGNTAAPIVASVSYNFVSTDIGNWLYIQAGTNWTPGWYKIQSIVGVTAVLEAAVGSANVRQVVNNLYGANTVIGCATVATQSANKATFTIDYSQSTACITSTSVSDYASNLSSTTMTSATAAFTPVMVGNLFHLNNAGTGAFGIVGWYEIATYVNATTVTTDRTTNSGTAMVAGQGKIGGALSLGSSDDAVFELAVSSATAATRYFVNSNSGATYTLGGTVSLSTGANGNVAWPVIIESYSTSRGNRLTTGRPLFDAGAAAFTTLALNWNWYGIRFTSSVAGTTFVATSATNSQFFYCKFTNTATSAARIAMTCPSGALVIGCEFVSYRGIGMSETNQSYMIYGCYFHDSDIGFQTSQASYTQFTNCIFANNVTTAFKGTAANTGPGNCAFVNCTFYGAANKTGVGITLTTGTTYLRLLNNIFYGFTTAISHPDVNASGYDDYNNYFNNTADVTAAVNWQKGAHDTALDPQFANAVQLTGTTATVSGSVLTQVGADYTNVTNNVDFVLIVSGTGITTANVKYLITSHTATTLTLSSAPGDSAGGDVVWQTTTGHNFAVGANMRAVGYPGTFPAGLTTGYTDIGAAARRESKSSFSFID